MLSHISKTRILFITLFTLMLIFIFSLSNQNAVDSSKLSVAVTQAFVPPSVPNPEEVAKATHHTIRDLAHIGLFAVLSFICMTGLVLDKLSPRKASCFTLIIIFFCALADECIQLFSDGRAFQISDLAKDMFGASLSILFVLVCHKIYTVKTKKSPLQV